MLAPHIKKKVDELWNRFWAAGITNPLVAIEQITYLIFLKRLEEIDAKREAAAVAAGKPYQSIYTKRATGDEKLNPDFCRWSYIRAEKTDVNNLIDNVFPWLRSIDSRLQQSSGNDELASLSNRMADAYFQLDPNKGKVLSDAIDAIDQLFARSGDASAAQDVMGDTFEYLLGEVASAGKNGQFRTPRHLIRFMVELLDPEPGQNIIDPAAGTGGFLFSAQQYLMRKYSAPGNVVLEWDGAPHHTDGANATADQWMDIHNGANFVGLDNDRTMARIGWMNMVLHDISNPQLLQGDSLSKRDGKPQLAKALEEESYEFVLANPPFTGTVDSNDLEQDAILFPRAGDKGKKKTEVITNKSELLFLWLMLDLLQFGGNCAVIIPEGVLFGNTDAHITLRRELLTQHQVKGIISLPGGVFQPYTGVKTSIILFQKETKRDAKSSFTGQKPATEQVWFYEVEQDGFTLNAKRDARPGAANDLWDALEKFKAWRNEGASGAAKNEKTYLQPSFRAERWRQATLRDTADNLTAAGHAFADQGDTGAWDGKTWGIHQLFKGLPVDPKQAEQAIRKEAGDALHLLALQHFTQVAIRLWDAVLTDRLSNKLTNQDLQDRWQKSAKADEADFKRMAKEYEKFFESDDSPALPIWRDLVKQALSAAQAPEYTVGLLRGNQPPKALTALDVNHELAKAARQVAQLDGFDVTTRSEAIDQASELKAAKHWVVPVRTWLRNDEWRSADGAIDGSHDAQDMVRQKYIEAMLAEKLYDDKGNLKDGLLDPDCIEAREWNLSAGQYKPFDFTQLKSDKSISELIGELRETELGIVTKLDTLLAMVEGRQ